MRLLLTFVAVLSCLAASILVGQDPPLPKPETQDAAPNATPTPEAPMAPTPTLIPPDILPAPDPRAPASAPALDIPTIEQLDQAMSPPPLSPAAVAYRQHIEWRKLRNQAQNDPKVKEALAKADAARTDVERRKLLARYFEIYFAKMKALAPADMKTYLDARKAEHLAALPQPKTRPGSVPSPSPTATPSSSSSASPVPTATPLPTISLSPSPSRDAQVPGARLPRP